MKRLAALLLAGCAAAGTAPEPAAPASAAASSAARDVFFNGRVVPTEPLLLHAPPNVFKVAGWSSSSDWIQLVELVEDGARVKKGEVIGRFNFRGDSALPRIEQRIREAQANAERTRTQEDEKLRELRHTEHQARVTAERATVDTQRTAALSAREARRIEIEARLARFEADAAAKRVAAQALRRDAEVAFQERTVALRAVDRKVFDAYKERFLARAPVDGVVRHAWYARRKRRVEKGDDMPAGMHFAAVAKDERLSVRFYLPEARLADATAGRVVHVKPVAGQSSADARITQIDPFPQPLGFLEDDWELTSALERFFVVHAEIDGAPGFPAGVEAEVRL